MTVATNCHILEVLPVASNCYIKRIESTPCFPNKSLLWEGHDRARYYVERRYINDQWSFSSETSGYHRGAPIRWAIVAFRFAPVDGVAPVPPPTFDENALSFTPPPPPPPDAPVFAATSAVAISRSRII